FRWNSLPVEAAKESQRFEDSEFLGEFRFLQRYSDFLAYLIVGLPPLHSQNLDITAACFQQAFQNLDCRGLAGPIGPKETEAFADSNGKIEAVDRIHRWLAGVLLVKLAANNSVGHPDIMPKRSCKVVSPSAIMEVMTRRILVVF